MGTDQAVPSLLARTRECLAPETSEYLVIADFTQPLVFTQESPSLRWQRYRGQLRKSRYQSTKAAGRSSSSRGVTHVACPAHPEEQSRVGFVPRSNHVCCRSESVVGAQRSAKSPSHFLWFSCQLACGP